MNDLLIRAFVKRVKEENAQKQIEEASEAYAKSLSKDDLSVFDSPP